MTSMSNTTQKHFIVEQIPLPTWVSDEKGLIYIAIRSVQNTGTIRLPHYLNNG